MNKFFLYSFLFLSIVAYSQDNKPIDWSADLEYLKVELPKNHYKLYHSKDENYFIRGIDKINAGKKNATDLDIAIRLQQLIASMGDSHTRTGWENFVNKGSILPLQLMWFSDGVFVQGTTIENQSLLGNKIVTINRTPLSTIADSIGTLFTQDNAAVIKNQFPKYLPIIQLLKYFGFARTDTIELLLENQKSEKWTYLLRPSVPTKQNRRTFQPDSIALCYKNARYLFTDSILKADNVYYIQYNQCASREYPLQGYTGKPEDLPSFTEFKQKILDNINKYDFDKVVFDLRFNGGGNSQPGTELVTELATIGKINQKGKLFVIVGRKTFSSAVINAMDFKNMTQAIFVGEETEGKPNHFGDIKIMTLPHSGLKIQYSTKYFKRSNTNLNTITPDQITETSFQDFKSGNDPAYEWVRKQ